MRPIWTLPFLGVLAAAGAATLAPAPPAAAWPHSHPEESSDCPAPEPREFDFWIGEWDVTNRQRNPAAPDDTTLYETGPATSRVYPILGGCAIVEHWEGDLVYGRVLGFSVRAWDPGRRVWTLLLEWPSPSAARFSTLDGRFEDGVGSFARERSDGSLVRYRFLDIEPRSFRWEGAASDDGGRSWSRFWVMDFRRREPPGARALLNGPSRTTDRCPSERARAYDFLLGVWRGEERRLAPDGTTRQTRVIALEAWSILDGCAVMDFVTYGSAERASGEAARGPGGAEREPGGAAPADRFRVRSFVASEDRWVQYSLDRDDPVFVRWSASTAEDLVLTTTRGEEETLERVRWLEVAPDRFRRDHAVSEDGGRTWRTIAEAELERR